MQPEHIPVGDLFAKECTYTVPLFQRPYVWEDERWEPLWEDVERVAAHAAAGGAKVRPHFLGSVVLQQRMGGIKQGPRREVIDGQQRLTTLQLLIKAVADVLDQEGDTEDAARPLRPLLRNAYPPKGDPEAAYKVWPTNVDRASFRALLDGGAGAAPGSDRLAQAYTYFHERARAWIRDSAEGEARTARADALATTLRQRLWLIALNLGDEDQAQVIFETLNARGTPLLPADLVKNLLLRRAEAEGADTEALYNAHWQVFDEDPFWREEIGRGHAVRARIDVFLQQALQAWTRDEVTVGELYSSFADHVGEAGTGVPTTDWMSELSRHAGIARSFYQADEAAADPVLRFAARLRAMDFQTVFPLLLHLRAHPTLAAQDVAEAATALESYLVRRMVCGLGTRSYGRFFVERLAEVADADPVAPALRKVLTVSKTDPMRWPDDQEFGQAWRSLPIYRTLRRDRLTMVLRAVEMSLRGDKHDPVPIPKTLHVEHVMPQGWRANWPLPAGAAQGAEEARDAAVQPIGNLTLLKSKLNEALSNSAWSAKQPALHDHGLFVMNAYLAKRPKWDEDEIRARGDLLFQKAVAIWPGPA